jgi:hypothetical protein
MVLPANIFSFSIPPSTVVNGTSRDWRALRRREIEAELKEIRELQKKAEFEADLWELTY